MGGRKRENWTRDATRRMLRSQAPKCSALRRRERRKVLGASRRRFIGSASNALLEWRREYCCCHTGAQMPREG